MTSERNILSRLGDAFWKQKNKPEPVSEWTKEEWRLQHDLINIMKDVASGHYTPTFGAYAALHYLGRPAIRDLFPDVWQPEPPNPRVIQYEARIPCGKCGHVHLGHCSICNNCEQIEAPMGTREARRAARP